METETPLESREPFRIRYLRLVKSNANFRRLWSAQLISQIGDWFYTLALYDLLFQLTGSGMVVGWAIILQSLPWFFMTPVAGLITDRFSRRRIMMVADLARAGIVLGLLLVETRADLWLVYVLLGLEVSFASLFEPARNALLPDLVGKQDLLPANALASATWSLTLAVGMTLGGLVAATFGRQVTFLVNSGSFLLSAVLIRRILVAESHFASPAVLLRVSPESGESPGREVNPDQMPSASLLEGFRYLRTHSQVFVTLLAKTGLGMVGGSLLVLVLFGQEVFPVSNSGILGTSLLFAARGVGTLIGPLVGESIVRGRPRLMRRTIGAGFFLAAFGYVALGFAPSIPFAALILMLGHMGGSNVWVMSTALMHMSVPTKLRGRVFSLDMGLHTLASSICTFLLGKGRDDWGLSPRMMAGTLGIVLLLPATLWTLSLLFVGKDLNEEN